MLNQGWAGGHLERAKNIAGELLQGTPGDSRARAKGALSSISRPKCATASGSRAQKAAARLSHAMMLKVPPPFPHDCCTHEGDGRTHTRSPNEPRTSPVAVGHLETTLVASSEYWKLYRKPDFRPTGAGDDRKANSDSAVRAGMCQPPEFLQVRSTPKRLHVERHSLHATLGNSRRGGATSSRSAFGRGASFQQACRPRAGENEGGKHTMQSNGPGLRAPIASRQNGARTLDHSAIPFAHNL